MAGTLDDDPSTRIEFAALYELLNSDEGFAIQLQKQASREVFNEVDADLLLLLPSSRYLFDGSAAFSSDIYSKE
jgi:hypothetical protein